MRGPSALDLDALSEVLRVELAAHERPASIVRVADLPMSAGYRVIKARLRRDFARPDGALESLAYDAATESYRPA